MNHRPKRIASTLKKAVHEALAREIADPRVQGLVTVTDVEVSHDLRHARIYVSVIPPDAGPKTVQGLQSAAPRIQRVVNDRIVIRRPPRIEFVLDERLKKQAEVMAAIQRVAPPPETSSTGDNQAAASGADELRREFETSGSEDEANEMEQSTIRDRHVGHTDTEAPHED